MRERREKLEEPMRSLVMSRRACGWGYDACVSRVGQGGRATYLRSLMEDPWARHLVHHHDERPCVWERHGRMSIAQHRLRRQPERTWFLAAFRWHSRQVRLVYCVSSPGCQYTRQYRYRQQCTKRRCVRERNDGTE